MLLHVVVLLLGSALVEGIDECLEISAAVTCNHKPRYTASGCQCACDWIATFKDSQTGMVIVLPDGPGSTTPCAGGCCNPNSEAGGDWCYPAANDFNTQRGCGTARETCLAAGAVPATGGVTTRAAIPGVPSDQNNICTDGGQLCVDPNTVTTDDWQCQCVAPKTGTPGQQALATCVATTIAPTDAPATNVPPPTYKNECEEISAAVTCNHKPRYTASGCQCACDWMATFRDAQTGMVIVYPDGPGSTTPCAGGCCNPNSEAGGDWCYPAANDFNTQRGCSTARETCLAAGAVPATGGVTTRAAIPGVPSDQNNICTDGGQLCVDPNTMADNDWQCQCVAPKTGTPGQQALATCVATTIAPTDAPATNVPPPTYKNECEEISAAVTCNHKPRYTASGCQCACDWIATFKDQNGLVIVLPDGPGSTTPCAGGCCNPNSEAGGDWCYPAANDFNTQRGCSTARETCLAAGAVPATGGVPPRSTIPGIPDSQNNICTDGGQICVDPNTMTDDDWVCKCVAPKVGTSGQQQVAVCDVPTAAPTTVPTALPTTVPTAVPTTVPTTVPTDVPTTVPTAAPTTVPGVDVFPTTVPTTVPTAVPGAVVHTAVPGAVVPTTVPGVVGSTTVPTAVPGAVVTTTVPGVVGSTAVPGGVVPTTVPGVVGSTTVPTAVPGAVVTTTVPGVVGSTTVPTTVPGAVVPTAVPGVVGSTTVPTAVPVVVVFPTSVPTAVPGAVVTTTVPGVAGSTTVPTAVPGVVVPTTVPGVAVSPTTVPTTSVPTAEPTPLRTSAPTAPNNAPGFDETDAPTTDAQEKDDSGTPWWVWVLIGLGILIVLLLGGMLLCSWRRGKGTYPPTVDSHHIQDETELLYHGADEAMAC